MNSRWRNMLAVTGLGAVLLAGASPVRAHNFCQVVSVTETQGGFTPTPLDAWAFKTVGGFPATTVVRQILVCPAVVTTPPVFVSPSVFFVDPPSISTQGSGGSVGGGVAPAATVSGVVPPVTVRDVVRRPEQFDRQVISLVGDAAELQPARDARGMPYTGIRLENGGASVVAVAWGTPAVHEGQRIRVTGNFYARAPFALAPGSSGQSVLEAEVIKVLP